MGKPMSELEQYYNKFNEEKRLNSRYGQVEYLTSMKYIHKYLEQIKEQKQQEQKQQKETEQQEQKQQEEQKHQKELEQQTQESNSDIKILDIGAGTGKYSVALANEGYDVTAVELVKYNLGILKQKGSSVKAMQGNALKLSKLSDNQFDLTLLFGPMYHLFTKEDKCRALKEAKRVTKPGGIILVAYCMNEYCVITYAFKEKHIEECLLQSRLTEDFHSVSAEKDLYDYVRIEDIDALNEAVGLKRIQIITPDGPANYIRPVLNEMDDSTFEQFMRFHYATCERQDLIGAAAHTVDILQKE